jgi:hypothetical protein
MMTPEQKRAFEETYITFARLWGMETAGGLNGTFGYNSPSTGKMHYGWLTLMDCAMDFIAQCKLQEDIEAACLAAGVGSMYDYAKGNRRESTIRTYYLPRRSDAMALRAELRASRDKSPRT